MKNRNTLLSIGWFGFDLALGLAVWRGVVWLFDMPDYILPPPEAVFTVMWRSRTLLLTNALVTVQEFLIGFGLAVILGVSIAIPIAFSRIVENVAYPYLVVMQTASKIALAPLFLIWFGFGATMNAAVVILTAIFPIIINTVLGLQALEKGYVQLARTMNATSFRLFLKIRLPVAYPAFFAGLRVSVGLALIGAVVGEYIASNAGLAHLTLIAAANQEMALLISAIIGLSIIGLIGFSLISLLNRYVLRHHS